MSHNSGPPKQTYERRAKFISYNYIENIKLTIYVCAFSEYYLYKVINFNENVEYPNS